MNVPSEMSVSVDRDFARFGSKSFAINKINTVDVTARRPHSQNAFFGWGLLAAMSLLLFAGGGKSGVNNGTAIGLLLCLLFAFLAYRAWKRSKIIEYYLMLVTSSHSVLAIKSRDSNFIQGVRDQIERAMSGRLD
jgi:hypothetical protein